MLGGLDWSARQESSRARPQAVANQAPAMAVEPCKVFVVAGTSSGVGKTTLAVGLMAMLRYGAHPLTLCSGLVQAPEPADCTKAATL